MIEYVDSRGNPSTRRITVFSIVAGGAGVPCLIARCHERNATRQFRVDRIKTCIDYDGEVHDDVAGFLVDTFGMSLSVAQAEETEERRDRWREIAGIIRSDAVLLAALSRSDGVVRRVETDVVIDHLALKVERNGVFLDDGEVAAISSYMRRLRPTPDAIGRALDDIGRSSRDHLQRFFMAARQVIEADGVLHPQEIDLINAMARELIGVAVM